MIALLQNPLLVTLLAEGGSDADQWWDALGAERADPGWVVFGLCAQALIAGCIVVHFLISWRRHRMVIPPVLGYAAIVATLMLLIYAAQHHDLVFMIGQFLNMLICIRLLMLIRRAEEQARADETPSFPIVSPDSAERKLPGDRDSANSAVRRPPDRS